MYDGTRYPRTCAQFLPDMSVPSKNCALLSRRYDGRLSGLFCAVLRTTIIHSHVHTSTGASTPYKHWSKCSVIKLGGRFFRCSGRKLIQPVDPQARSTLRCIKRNGESGGKGRGNKGSREEGGLRDLLHGFRGTDAAAHL